MKVSIGISLLILGAAISSALAHDGQVASRELLDGESPLALPWKNGHPACSAIMRGARNSYTQRVVQFLGEEDTAFQWTMGGEHCGKCGGAKPPTVPPPCNDPDPAAALQDQFLNVGVPAARYEGERPLPGGFTNKGRGCPNEPIDLPVNIEKGCPNDKAGCPDQPELGFESGEYVAQMKWSFLNQGPYDFFNCVDFSVARAAGQLNASLGAVILANLFWLLPVALLPVVGAAVYARRHKAESMRASMAAGARMSAVTAAPATGYRSGFTAKNSSGNRMSATTADAATPYKSGFSGMNSQGRNSGVTAAPATPYKSGLTGAADLASANTASTGKSYSSGYTGLSE